MDRNTKIQHEHFIEAVRERAERLRRLAADIDRIADRAATVHTPGFRGWSGADNLAYAAASVVHEVMSTLPNLTFDTLINEAQRIDEMVIREEVES